MSERDAIPTAMEKRELGSMAEISSAVLAVLPQQHPFRYLDRIIEIDAEHIIGQYTYKHDEWFYQGHFPGDPVTPGVIQIETMAQTAVVAFGLYLVMMAERDNPDVNMRDYLTVFTDVEAEFLVSVPPGATVTVKAEKVFWRRMKLRSKASLFLADGTLAATATLSGIGVKRR